MDHNKFYYCGKFSHAYVFYKENGFLTKDIYDTGTSWKWSLEVQQNVVVSSEYKLKNKLSQIKE